MTHELVSQNALLRDEVSDLHSRLNNVTHSKMFLEGQLGKVKTDLDGLKSNTSRWECVLNMMKCLLVHLL